MNTLINKWNNLTIKTKLIIVGLAQVLWVLIYIILWNTTEHGFAILLTVQLAYVALNAYILNKRGQI